ncbi:MAG: hypothetical protein WD894_18640 [Pirellulales bacterium]
MRRFVCVVCTAVLMVSAIAVLPERAPAQTLRERLQKAREDREAAAGLDSADARRPPLGRGPAGRQPAGRGAAKAPPPSAARAPARINQTAQSASQWVTYLARMQPKDAAGYADLQLEQFAQGVSAVEYWTAQLAQYDGTERVDHVLAITERLLAIKDGIDRQLETAMAQRTGFADIKPAEKRHEAATSYFWATSSYIDLSGRLRYLLFDALNFAADTAVERPENYNRLLDLLVRYKSGIGAVVVSSGLFDPPPSEEGAVPVSLPAKLRILRLVGDSGNYELVPELARLVKHPRATARLVIAAADALVRLGLPQEQRPGQDPTLPKPSITARELAALLAKQDLRRLTAEERAARDRLVATVRAAAKSGLAGDTYRLGSIEIQPGDWLLMRNPSPYNLFTDLSPGLFTHVGVAAIERGSDGVRRMVIIDIPERGPEMPATNVDTFVQRTRHFVFLRHPDADTARQMAEAAVATVGNVTEFDLNFRTDRVLALRGLPLAGQKIHTYCAGYLYLCALQTDRPREEFFPLSEGPAPGYTADNLAKFGFTFGEDFISPTGAFFSPTLRLVGRRDPMYDPRREVEEAVFDHFAQSLMTREVTPAPDAFQLLRLKVAEAAKDNPLLAKAVAGAVGVAQDMDLVAAAKAKALIEALDEIAYGASGDFLEARDAIMSGGTVPPGTKLSAAEQSRLRELHTRHASLVDRWQKRQLTPRALRIELVQYYIAEGKRRLEERFFE